MRILGIESASLVASVAIVTDDVITAEYTVNLKKTHSQTLLPMIDEIVKMLEVPLESIDAIAVSGGPGSFTGLRIGSATAKGLGLALKKPLIHVPTMDAMGYCLYGASALICPMLDARRQQVYTGLYRYEEKFEIVKEQYITDIHALIAELNERGERVIFLGDGVPVNRAVIEEEMKVPYSFAPAQASRQRASAVAALGAVYLAEGKTETAAEHKPDYLRKSQAEREREVAERQGEMDKLAAGIVVVEKNNGGRNGNAKEASCSDSGFSAGGSSCCSGTGTGMLFGCMVGEAFTGSADEQLGKIWVLKEDETVRGYSNFRVIAGEGELMRIAVHGACRGRGYGRLLMERLLREAEEENVEDITLEVRASKPRRLRCMRRMAFRKRRFGRIITAGRRKMR